MENNNQGVVIHQQVSSAVPSIFNDMKRFEDAQRIAKLLSYSDLVPDSYKESGNGKGLANTLIAINIANQTQSDVLMVMQNLNIIHGKPSWSAQFIIAAINSCGRFEPMEFITEGSGDNKTCYAVAVSKASGTKIIGPKVSISMAKAEGWFSKKGSKWQTMPDLMMQYRAATFFGRLHAPDILMGMRTQDEVEDIGYEDLSTNITVATPNDSVKKLNEKIANTPKQAATNTPTTTTPTENTAVTTENAATSTENAAENETKTVSPEDDEPIIE